jgi:hypothetical protein
MDSFFRFSRTLSLIYSYSRKKTEISIKHTALLIDKSEHSFIHLWFHSFFTSLFSYTVDRLLGRGISPSQGLNLHAEEHKHRINAHNSSGIRTHDPSFWAGGNSLCPKSRGHCNRLINIFFSMALPVHSGPRLLIQFRNNFSQTLGLLGRVISPSQGLYLTQDNTNTE